MRFLYYFAIPLCLFSCKTETLQPLPLSQESITRHMSVLASDEFQGRMPCTEGGRKTVNYLKEELQKIGLKAVNGSYTQDVPLVDINGTMDSTMVIQTQKGSMVLQQSKDFVIHTERPVDRLEIKDSELVFCGYGIKDDKSGWNDYAGIDMKGKIAVVLINDPGYGSEDTSFFKGNAMTYGGRWDRKYDVADEVGADGLLIIHETASAGYPWFVVSSSWSGSLQGLDGVDRSTDAGLKGWITLDVAQTLFNNSKLNLGEMIREARKPGFKAVPLNATLSTGLNNEYTSCVSKNVIGYIEGKTKPDEYIVYTAHWDHIGIGVAVDGDSIYNGALDNASGTATLLAIAESMIQQEAERSVVFLFVTAEEQGLLGSEYYAENPLFPMENTVANINLDGVNPAGEMNDLTITGMGHSEMDDLAAKAAKEQGRYVQGEAEPEKGYFFRSDQFNFARKGVPVLYAEGGYDHKEKGKEYAKEFKESYTAKRYHAPADQYDPNTWNFGGMMQDGALYQKVGWDLINSDKWPKWYPESEFKREKVKG
jgi:Zn-dependent M28 family amino/carboxypeptidase